MIYGFSSTFQVHGPKSSIPPRTIQVQLNFKYNSRNSSSDDHPVRIRNEPARPVYNYSKMPSINPTPFMYVLHNLQGQLLGIHDLIEFLISAKLEHTLNLFGNIVFHTIGPKDLREFSPVYTLMALWSYGRIRA